MHDEMPGFFPGRPGGEHDEPLLDMILERRSIPPGAPREIHGLARMLAAVAGPAEPGDLAGQAAAQAAFTRLASPPGTSPAALRSARRSLPERPARGRLPLAAALAVAAAAGLGSTAAAYADVLPSPIQHFAHVAFGAPPPPHDLALHAPAATSSPTPAHSEPSTSAPAQRQLAGSPGPFGGKAHSGGFHLRKGHDAGPGYASCATVQNNGRAAGHSQDPAQPSPAPNQVKPGSDQGQGGPGQTQGTAPPGYPSGLFSLPTTACPGGTTPAKATDAAGQ
jgi:hypothetical protein